MVRTITRQVKIVAKALRQQGEATYVCRVVV